MNSQPQVGPNAALTETLDLTSGPMPCRGDELTTKFDHNDIRAGAVLPDTPIGRYLGQRQYRTDRSYLTS